MLFEVFGVTGEGPRFTRWTSILTALGYVFSGYNAFTVPAHGHLPVSWHPDGMNFMRWAYQPTGRLRIPMVALDVSWDNVAPLFHKDAYRALVAAEGASDLLFRAPLVPEYRHCPSTAAPVLAAFQQLSAWVEMGVHP